MNSTTYISCYWNKYNCPVRKKLCQDFMDRYPWVTLLQVGEDIKCVSTVHYSEEPEGFIDYVLINRYLSENSVYNLVVIDSDLILHKDFQMLMENSLSINDFVHGFDHAWVIRDEITEYFAPSFYSKKFGHTGYILGFSNNFLKKIDYKFLQFFLIGGADYILAQIITGRSIGWCKDFTFYEKLLKFQEKIGDVKYSVLNHFVVHVWHGDSSERLTPFKKYSEPLNTTWLAKRNLCIN